MFRGPRLLTLALGAVLAAVAAAGDDRVPFVEGLRHMGSCVVESPVVRPAEGPRSRVVLAEGLVDGGNEEQPLERAFGPSRSARDFTDADTVEPPRSTAHPIPERTVPPFPAAVPLESMLAGDDLGRHNRVHDVLVGPPRPAPETSPQSAPGPVISADYFTDATAGAATIQLLDDQLPPAPPAAVPLTPESPPAAVPGRTPPATAPYVSSGFVDPRYESTSESSIYTSVCRRCGRTHCHCVYAPFGDAVRSAFGQQIHRGSARLLTLYAYDFHPVGTPHQSQLTSRGSYQLDKMVARLQYTPSPIRIEASGNDSLDAARRIRVLESLGALGIADADGLVVTVRTGAGRPAIEMLESSYDLLESIRLRGRTIEEGGSATFTGGAQFGQ